MIRDRLTDRQRQVILMHMQGMREIDIAAELGVNPPTVCRTLKRAMNTIEYDLRLFVKHSRRNWKGDDE